MPNGKRYWQLSTFGPLNAKYVRIDSGWVHFWEPLAGPDRPVLNLQAPVGHSDSITWGPRWWSTVARIDTEEFFGRKTPVRSYHLEGLLPYNVKLADSFGIVRAEDMTDAGGPYNYIWDLIGGSFGGTSYGILDHAPEPATVLSANRDTRPGRRN